MTAGHRPSRPGGDDPGGLDGQPRFAVGLRAIDLLAGLLAAGILLAGVSLLLFALIAPARLAAAGHVSADGPGWDRVIVHLAVGAAGEVVVRRRGNWPAPVRVAADAAVILGSVGVIWWGWWP